MSFLNRVLIVFIFVESRSKSISSCLMFTFNIFSFQPNAQTDDDVTPLVSAVAAGSLSCLKLLIEV